MAVQQLITERARASCRARMDNRLIAPSPGRLAWLSVPRPNGCSGAGRCDARSNGCARYRTQRGGLLALIDVLAWLPREG